METKDNYSASAAFATTYLLNGITYLPHYQRFVYVAPGHIETKSREYTAHELLLAGAVMVREFLWTGGPLRGALVIVKGC
jgi:hypothetical protein